MAQDLKNPRVSVVMSVYNGERYLRLAIEGVLAQTFKDFEFIIVDDGSVDDTPNILAEYAKKDKRIKVLHHENHGLVYSLNRGIGEARGEYIARHDADDISMPDRFGKEVDYLESHPDTVAVGSSYIELDESSKELRTTYLPTLDEEIRLNMYFTHVFAHGSVMMRRQAFRQAGGYRQEYWPGEDLDLWRRLARLGRLANLRDSLYKYRMNENGISLSNLEQQQGKIRKIHEELRSGKLLLANTRFLATIKSHDPSNYEQARRRTMALAKQMLKRGKVANARFLAKALRSKSDKPKVLMVSPTKWLGGGEIYTAGVIKGLARNYQFYLWSGEKLRERLGSVSKNMRIPIFPVVIRKLLKRTRPLEELYYKSIYHVRFRLSDLDLINIQAYEPSVLNALSKQSRVPVIFTAHTRFPMRDPQEKAFINKTLRNVTRVVCVSKAAQEDLIEIGVPAGRCVVIHNGVNTERFKPAEGSHKYVTWIGRMENALKNPMLFLDIAREAKRSNPSLQFRMVGEGELVPKIKALIQEEGLSNLELTGFVQDTPKIYHEASVVCLTSTSESLPLVVLEAMSAGVPVVSTDVGGISEIISSKELGTLLSLAEPERFISAIEQILGSKDKYKQLSKRVRRHIVQNFSQEQMLVNTKNLFDKVIK